MPSFPVKRFRAFLASIIQDWISLMSGGIGLILTVVSFYVPPSSQAWVFLLLGILCVFYASYRAWLIERKDREWLLEEREPHLEFVRDGRVKPYFAEMPLGDGARERVLRVGVRNRGFQPALQARIVLEACEPGSSHAVHLEHELQPMGKPSGTLFVAIPAQGLVVIDVAHEFVGPGETKGELHLSYARVAGVALPETGEGYALVLRAEGGGLPVRWSAILGGPLESRLEGRLA